MKNKQFISRSLIALSILSFSLCDTPQDPIVGNPVEDVELRPGTAITGWGETAGTYNEFTPENLSQTINGGDYSYIHDNILVNGFFIDLTNSTIPDTVKTCAMMCNDYGTEANATSKFLELTSEISPTSLVDIPDFDANIVTGKRVGGGHKSFGHFGKYYFEITLTGYPDYTLSLQHASDFYTYYSSIIQ